LFQRWSDDAGTRRGHEARHEPAMTRTTSQQLATFASTTNFDDLTPDVRSSTHLRFLDTLGISLAASVDGAGDGVLQLVRSWGGSRDAGIIGATGQFPAAAAAFVNGTLAHALDFDDTHLPSLLHPSSSIIPAVLAVGELTDADGP